MQGGGHQTVFWVAGYFTNFFETSEWGLPTKRTMYDSEIPITSKYCGLKGGKKLQIYGPNFLSSANLCQYTTIHFRWLFPFIGHMGICTSNGVIRDFAGPYFVSVSASRSLTFPCLLGSLVKQNLYIYFQTVLDKLIIMLIGLLVICAEIKSQQS